MFLERNKPTPSPQFELRKLFAIIALLTSVALIPSKELLTAELFLTAMSWDELKAIPLPILLFTEFLYNETWEALPTKIPHLKLLMQQFKI